jgi:pimeloyl-ACP methyl ester carboxylesterase
MAGGEKSLVKETTGKHADVNGLSLYYEIHGAGKPLIVLHGGVAGIVMFGPTLPALSRSRQVIAPELQAHGRTADIDRPLRFDTLANDIAALMKRLGIEKADILGNSLGGAVALRIAIDHPDVVDRLVIVSQPFKRTGWYPEVLAAFDRMGPADAEGMKRSPLVTLYPRLDWEGLFSKLGDLLRQDYNWAKEVEEIKAPTLLVFADADAISTAHIMEFYGLLGGGKHDAGLDGSKRPNAQLAVLPACTHYSILTSPLIADVVGRFLDTSPTT